MDELAALWWHTPKAVRAMAQQNLKIPTDSKREQVKVTAVLEADA